MRKAILAGLVVVALGAGTANAGGTWVQGDRFHRTSGRGPIRTVIFRGHCLDAEDSAAHPNLGTWDTTAHKAIFTCPGI